MWRDRVVQVGHLASSSATGNRDGETETVAVEDRNLESVWRRDGVILSRCQFVGKSLEKRRRLLNNFFESTCNNLIKFTWTT